MNIKVSQFEKLPSKVVYWLQITLDQREYEFQVRYSSLLDIHEKFLESNEGKGTPSFPPKKLFGNRKEKFLNERLRLLNHYFVSLFKLKDDFDYDIQHWTDFIKLLIDDEKERNNLLLKDSIIDNENNLEVGMDREAYEENLLIDFEKDLLRGFQMKEFPGFDVEQPGDKAIRELAEMSETYITSQFGKIVDEEKLREQYPETDEILNSLLQSAEQMDDFYSTKQQDFSKEKIEFWHDVRRIIK